MMILPDPKDAIHKAWLYRLLTEILDNKFLSANLRFKGGTCAAMQGFIDRFSVDLDFDLLDENRKKDVQKNLEVIFKKLGLEIKDQSQNVPQYFLKYPVYDNNNTRNTLKLDITFPPPENNIYELVRLVEIDRIAHCQIKESMFANKLVAFMERFSKHGSIAGRDLYDIHTFFLKGYRYEAKIIKERTQKTAIDFFKSLDFFITNNVTQTVIDQDLNTLLPIDNFHRIRKIIKQEVLMFVNDEIIRLNK